MNHKGQLDWVALWTLAENYDIMQVTEQPLLVSSKLKKTLIRIAFNTSVKWDMAEMTRPFGETETKNFV